MFCVYIINQLPFGNLVQSVFCITMRNIDAKNHENWARSLAITTGPTDSRQIQNNQVKTKRCFGHIKFNSLIIFWHSCRVLFCFRYPKQHIAIKLLYLGWDYQGFASIEDSTRTIEHHLFAALTKSCLIESRETSDYNRCGRTDKTVSAFDQVRYQIFKYYDYISYLSP